MLDLNVVSVKIGVPFLSFFSLSDVMIKVTQQYHVKPD